MSQDLKIRVPKELHAKLKSEAAKQDRSMNWIVNCAVRNYLKEQKK